MKKYIAALLCALLCLSLCGCSEKPHDFRDVDWGMSQNYHLSLDTGLVGIERCAQLIADVARAPGEPTL